MSNLINGSVGDSRKIRSNSWYWNSTGWVQNITNALTFNTYILAYTYINNNIANETLIARQPTVTNREKNPKYYKGIK